jgi:hypothetical protein
VCSELTPGTLLLRLALKHLANWRARWRLFRAIKTVGQLETATGRRKDT